MFSSVSPPGSQRSFFGTELLRSGRFEVLPSGSSFVIAVSSRHAGQWFARDSGISLNLPAHVLSDVQPENLAPATRSISVFSRLFWANQEARSTITAED